MALIKKNIWLAFHFILLFWSLFLGAAAYITYQSVYHEVAQEQKGLTLLTSNSLKSSFTQYETILNIVASELMRSNNFEDKAVAWEILNDVATKDQSIQTFAIFNLEGIVDVSAPILVLPRGESLLQLEESKTSFQDTLSSQEIVLGRTYFNKHLNSFILPFQKAVRDDRGNARFVLSLSINLERGFDYFLNSTDEHLVSRTLLYREKDRYFQLAPADQIRDQEVYRYQIPQEYVQDSIERLTRNTGESYDEIKQNGKVYINELRHPSRQSLSASTYLKQYDLWLTTEIKLDEVQEQFFQKALLLFFLWIASSLIMFALFRNIAGSEKRKQQELLHQARHDYLTGLYNRFYLEDYLSALPKKAHYSLVFLDIDNFKSVNDSYGHQVGDEVLIQVAKRLQGSITNDTFLVRTSSDEFVAITASTNQEDVMMLCECMKQQFDTPFPSKDYEVKLSVSVGVSRKPFDGKKQEVLKRNADLAMYESKKSRDAITFFEPHLLDVHLHNIEIEHHLRKALDNNELYLTYQPQLASNGSLKGVEALIRWNNEELGFVGPDRFIPIAESIGMMNAIGQFVIDKALEEISAIQDHSGLEFDLSINVSVKQFQSEAFFSSLISSVNKHQFAMSKLLLEVTESVLIDDVDRICVLMDKLRQQNIRISLDDFGTGYSSLSLLKNLPIDELKIDKSFVSDMLTDTNSSSMVEGVVAIAQKLKMVTVAEGVETEEVQNALRALGCDIYQGYYYSKPVPIEELALYLRSFSESNQHSI
ncbi:EAL domain-containing protein [Vibrio sp. HN007]|uniref:bifunctional diguanylate cyclase/phosphodiesterase n=1 Tax=Vibrio iocasae TaxID=3098914 RepID=UPI0035D40A47